jgi:allene oxide cyclase
MMSKTSVIVRTTIVAATALVVGGGIAMAGDTTPPGASPSARASATVFTVVERGVTDVVVYVNRSKNDVIGNTIGWGNKLYGKSNHKQIGRDQGSCYRTNPGKSWECTWTNLLPDGNISVQGVFRDVGDSRLAITGGTGKYKDASGYMALHARNASGTAYDFEFHVI